MGYCRGNLSWGWWRTRTPSGRTSWTSSAARGAGECGVTATRDPDPTRAQGRLLRGRGQRVSAVPRVLPRPLPGRAAGDDQVELRLPQPDNIRPGPLGVLLPPGLSPL